MSHTAADISKGNRKIGCRSKLKFVLLKYILYKVVFLFVTRIKVLMFENKTREWAV